MVILIALVILLIASFLMALPRKKKGLPHLLRFLMLMIGVIGPIIAVWVSEKPGSPPPILPLILSVVAIVPLSTTVALAATGWQALLRRRYGVEESLDFALLDPGLYFPSYNTPTSSSGGFEDLIVGCVVIMAVWVIMALFVLGIVVAESFDKHLLPPVKTRQVLRAVLCLAYALPMQAGVIGLFSRLFP